MLSRVCDVESVCGECVKWVCVEWEKGVGVCEMTQERKAKFGTRERYPWNAKKRFIQERGTQRQNKERRHAGHEAFQERAPIIVSVSTWSSPFRGLSLSPGPPQRAV